VPSLIAWSTKNKEKNNEVIYVLCLNIYRLLPIIDSISNLHRLQSCRFLRSGATLIMQRDLGSTFPFPSLTSLVLTYLAMDTVSTHEATLQLRASKIYTSNLRCRSHYRSLFDTLCIPMHRYCQSCSKI
jgi:hypothetical protein